MQRNNITGRRVEDIDIIRQFRFDFQHASNRFNRKPAVCLRQLEQINITGEQPFRKAQNRQAVCIARGNMQHCAQRHSAAYAPCAPVRRRQRILTPQVHSQFHVQTVFQIFPPQHGGRCTHRICAARKPQRSKLCVKLSVFDMSPKCVQRCNHRF